MLVNQKLPDGWVFARLGDICTTSSGGTPLRSQKRYYNGDIPWIKSGELEDDLILTSEERISKEGLENSSAKIFPKGTVVVALYGATVGKTGILNMDAATNQAVCAVFNDEQILDKKYLFYFLRSKREDFLKASFGGAQPNISQGIIRDTIISLAPLGEQRRIVAKVESLFAESKTARESLNKVSILLRRFRQSVLNKAFRGELTQRDPNDEPAEKLLGRIELERKNKGQQERIGWKPSKHQYKELQPPDAEDLLELPEGWKWARLGQICHVVKDHVEPGKKPEEAYTYLSIENVESESGNLVNFSPTLGKDIHSTKLVFTTQDVLYSKLRPYLNKVHIPNFSGISATDLIPLRPEGGIPREYVAYYLRTRRVVEYANQRTRGIQLPRLPVEELLALPTPLAPLEEQSRIISRIQEFFLLSDKIENTVKVAKARADNIDQAVLVKAFRGELVPQDPNDESASVLLERAKLGGAKMQVREKKKPEIRPPSKVQQTLAKPSGSVRDILKEMGQATIEQVLKASSLSISEFWDELKLEINAGRIVQIRRGHSVFLKVKD